MVAILQLTDQRFGCARRAVIWIEISEYLHYAEQTSYKRSYQFGTEECFLE